MQTLCLVLIVSSIIFIVLSIKGIRSAAQTLNHFYNIEALGFNRQKEIKEAKTKVNKYMAILIIVGFVDYAAIYTFFYA